MGDMFFVFCFVAGYGRVLRPHHRHIFLAPSRALVFALHRIFLLFIFCSGLRLFAHLPNLRRSLNGHQIMLVGRTPLRSGKPTRSRILSFFLLFSPLCISSSSSSSSIESQFHTMQALFNLLLLTPISIRRTDPTTKSSSKTAHHTNTNSETHSHIKSIFLAFPLPHYTT